MVEILYPDSIKKMKDSFGFHRVKVYNDNRILHEMIKLRIKAQHKKQDSIYLVCGIEGVGKSLLTLMAGEVYEKYKNVELSVENFTRRIDELIDRMAEIQRESFLTLDEGSELDAGRWNEKKTKEIKEKFTAIRERAFIIFICYTNPLKIVTYLREDRIRGVFFIKKAGCAYYYANSPENPHFTEILDRWPKDNRTKSLKSITKYAPDFIMYFPEYDGHLRTAYSVRKDERITEILGKRDVFKDPVIPPNYVCYKDAAKYLNWKPSYITQIVQQGKIKSYSIGMRNYLLKEDLDLMLNNKKNKVVN